MCDTCGCGDLTATHEHGHPHGAASHSSEGHDALHNHEHGQGHEHGPVLGQGVLRSIRVESDVLAKNNHLAAHNRGWLEAQAILALNLVSSPGAGKTALLERTLRDLAREWPWAVIEGDQQTDNDAKRIAACGVPVHQVNTGTGCHLDAQMVQKAVRALDPCFASVLLIENVGNLVCPALFDLGEAAKVVIASVTEGEDKPIKYPYMFEAAGLVLLNKIDLLPYVSFDTSRFLDYVRQVNPGTKVIALSATHGDNLADWYDWLRTRRAETTPAANAHAPSD